MLETVSGDGKHATLYRCVKPPIPDTETSDAALATLVAELAERPPGA